ncbi:MAG TPA: AbrB/MazE/SpoVT family DNA-binding domain-containing protein [Candidatus Pacearchaeota archaeon]|nr:spoVT / AbrB like domain protein [archaeon BMS3Abin17]HDK41988.1 AbrB/MazE/SpoVT family DNA-binding domain-containing protein [Candidatus Pacearchaeota archaeon]HDZ61481.1 AbrB/MazE/SpoVT family DNA-binding domain-containing protein [Candidatus Pacearchaeota archaeon]
MVSITKISSKGQIVIPRDIRERLKVKEGNLFVVTDQDNSICLRKIEPPKIKTWDEATKPFREAAKKSKFTEDDLAKVISEVRANKR